MLLATRCPFCETVFRLQPAQLALRRGLVRCGHCHEVFDASSSLFELNDSGDFSSAQPIAAAAAIEALSGVRPRTPDFSGRAWDPWAPDAPLDNRILHNASNLPLTPAATEAGIALTPRHATEPELPAGAFSAPVPGDREPALAKHEPVPDEHEPFLADAPLEPFAYDADPPADPAREPLVDRPAVPAEEAPRVWHKTERPSEFPEDEPVLGESATLYGIPDNEPRFGAAGLGAAGLGAAGLGAAGSGAASSRAAGSVAEHAAADGLGAAAAGAAVDAGIAGADANANASASARASENPSAGSRPAPPPSASSGEPFAVKPVHDGADPFPVTRETRPAEPRRLGWLIVGSVIAVLLVIALLVQLAWWQRETVMVYFPGSQTLYVKACAQLGCQITPPHDIDGLQVEPSDLRQIDGPHKLELKMPLRNRFNIALAYPAIELTLLDDQNNVAVRRVLWPQDYVAPGTPIASGLPGHTTQTMIVHLDTGNAVASNFRVQIFYP
ncbi:MAG TPA: DUF3426 domain-containing protein [Paraburkholderia sp.]|jgi:predicted Zn finger-like uncharacterized protein|nr:DUF3426 domain-containing protein [Paraburkholderia sp.]